MIDCEVMCDRMPDVAHGAAPWTEAEAGHLASCAECALEWRIVQAGMRLDADTIMVPDHVARVVAARLQGDRASGRLVGVLRWRRTAIGLLAAVASVLLMFGLLRHDRSPAGVAGDTAMAMTMLPELRQLDDGELASVLQSMGPSAGDATPGVLPHLEDLTDSELEQLLRSEGGQ